jgi:hypothetical protein
MKSKLYSAVQLQWKPEQDIWPGLGSGFFQIFHAIWGFVFISIFFINSYIIMVIESSFPLFHVNSYIIMVIV